MNWLTSIRDIKKAQENNQLVIFVGAGVSKNSNVPTWWELIKKIADEIKYDKCDTCTCRDKGKICPDKNCKNRYAFTQDEFLRIPEYFYQQHKAEGDNAYYDLIQSTLRGGNGPNSIDTEIFNLLPHHIITTNYDSLLEDSTAINSQLYAVVSKDSDLLSKANDRYIIKMHGDLELKDTIVLKESDYIDYEQKHPLISTFIRSLLVNHTFVFLGYSLNDYNLNLIIGWINYFRKIHGVEKRPANYLIDSKAATELEKSRLEDKSIYVVDLNSLPQEIENSITIPKDITDPIGRKLFSYLKCISTPKIIQKFIPLEERLIEKYETLKPYSKISYQDLINVYPLGRTTFMDTILVFFEKDWFDQIIAILDNPDSLVTKTFCRAGISGIHFFDDNSSKEVPNVFEPIDEIFQLYFDNDYVEVENRLPSSSNPIQKLYYYHLLGKDKEQIETVLKEIAEKYPADNYVEIILQKSRTRSALMSLFDREEEKTYELQQIFDTAHEKWRNSTSFLRMLFESAAKNMHTMDTLLTKHERRYEYRSNTFYSEHAHTSLWKLKSYAYDYYFFFIENGLPLHYYSNPKEYLSYYLKSILCTYSPSGKNSNGIFLGSKSKQPHYTLNEIDIDMMVKYSKAKDLKAWIKKYSVQEIEIGEDIDVVQKFSNFCSSMAHFMVRYWVDSLHCFAIMLCLIKLENHQKIGVLEALCTLMESCVDTSPAIIEEIFETIEYLISYLKVKDAADSYSRLIASMLSTKVYPLLIERHKRVLERILKKIGEFANETLKKCINAEIEAIENKEEKCEKMYMTRFLFPKDFCKNFFVENMDLLGTEEIFNLLIEQVLDFNEQCSNSFLNTIAKQDELKKQQPGLITYPDWLIITIEHSLVLKLLGFDFDLEQLSPYAHYSEHLRFMLEPEKFDYSTVDTSNYMWQNLIFSQEYQHYFVEHKDTLLTEELKNLFKMGVETTDQSKIVYGIFLEKDELRCF